MPKPQFIYAIDNIPLGKFDMGGVLYHANYFYLYELTREAFLKHIGYPYSDLIKNNLHLAVVEANQKFKKPIFYGDTVKIQLNISQLSKSSVTFLYKIVSANIEIHDGQTKHVLIENKSSKFSISKFSEQFYNKLNLNLRTN